MPKNCIICGKRAGSREHIFPAALGGRRTNKGIYCGAHNEGFGPLAAILADQLAPINALLGVRPDHSDQLRPLTIINPSDGQAYLISALKVELSRPKILKDAPVSHGSRQVQVQFSNEAQRQEWLAEQRAAGFKVEVQNREEGMGYFTQPYQVSLKLGGLDGLRAIGYVALTFLAHHFPKITRQPELKPFKDFVLGANNSQQPVWWDFSPAPDNLRPNSFRFGHRILIGLSSSRSAAFARVSLFSTLDFAAQFGSLRVASDKTVIVDIDPQADHPPADIKETREEKALALVDRPASLTSSLADAAESAKGRERFERLLRNIIDWQRECVAKELLPKIDKTKSLGGHERVTQVKELLSAHRQSILNLMLFVVDGLKQQFAADPATAPFVPAIDILVAGDPASATGISQTASCALELATTALAEQICRDHADGKLDLQRLCMLLGGGPGAAIVGKGIISPLFMALGIAAPLAG